MRKGLLVFEVFYCGDGKIGAASRYYANHAILSHALTQPTEVYPANRDGSRCHQHARIASAVSGGGRE